MCIVQQKPENVLYPKEMCLLSIDSVFCKRKTKVELVKCVEGESECKEHGNYWIYKFNNSSSAAVDIFVSNDASLSFSSLSMASLFPIEASFFCIASDSPLAERPLLIGMTFSLLNSHVSVSIAMKGNYERTECAVSNN